MPRTKSKSGETLTDNALNTFWRHGYRVVSTDDIVHDMGISRAGIHGDFPGKHDLFHACLDRYQEIVATPVFAPVETRANLRDHCFCLTADVAVPRVCSGTQKVSRQIRLRGVSQ